MAFNWRFRNFKRDPQPFLNGAVIDTENARNNLVQNAGNSMEGYTPLESTLAAQAMEGYRPAIAPNYTPFEASLDGYNVNSNIEPTENNPYLPAINQYYRRGR